jgi:ribosomal protein S18 acetylase RimI-like enzyme
MISSVEREPVIRRAVAGDVPVLTRLRAARRGPEDDARRWAEWAASSPRDDFLLLVACTGGAVLGYGVADRFEPPPDAPPHVAPRGQYLVGLMVDPSVRRRGIGAALVTARLAWVAERASCAWYFSDDDNVASIRLHERFAFKPVTNRFWHPGPRNPDSAMTLYRADLTA